MPNAKRQTWIDRAASEIGHRFYMLGYSGILLPRGLRKLLAQSRWHRSWLVGDMGIYGDLAGNQYGVCDRLWTFSRKGGARKEASYLTVFSKLLRPYDH